MVPSRNAQATEPRKGRDLNRSKNKDILYWKLEQPANSIAVG